MQLNDCLREKEQEQAGNDSCTTTGDELEDDGITKRGNGKFKRQWQDISEMETGDERDSEEAQAAKH